MSAFHFLRPEYFLLLLPAWTLVWWLLEQQSDEKKWQSIIDPKLLKHLLVEPKQNHSRVPAPWHLAMVLTLVVIAVSGPSWKLKEDPFTQDDTKIAFVVSVKESMLSSDIMPNRLSRSIIKIEELLKKHSDIESALIAYSGSAHLVLPFTKDHTIIKTFAEALDPDIMPLKGDNLAEALLLAQKEIATKSATIIVLTDSVSPSNAKLALKNGLDKGLNIILWKMASKELSSEVDFKSSAKILGAKYVSFSGDDSDEVEVSSLIDTNLKDAAQGDKSRYEDGGYWLIPFIFLFLLLWAREGFIAELWRHR